MAKCVFTKFVGSQSYTENKPKLELVLKSSFLSAFLKKKKKLSRL